MAFSISSIKKIPSFVGLNGHRPDQVSRVVISADIVTSGNAELTAQLRNTAANGSSVPCGVKVDNSGVQGWASYTTWSSVLASHNASKRHDTPALGSGISVTGTMDSVERDVAHAPDGSGDTYDSFFDLTTKSSYKNLSNKVSIEVIPLNRYTAGYSAGHGILGDMTLELSSSNGSAVVNSVTATIYFSDGSSSTNTINTLPPDPCSFSVYSTATNEGGGVTFQIVRSGGMSYPVDVSYSTEDGTALAGSDYITTSGTVTFNVGETSKTVNVATIATPADIEGQEHFFLNCSTSNQSANINNPHTAGYINSEVVSEQFTYDLRRDNIHILNWIPGDKPTDPGDGTSFNGSDGKIITIHGGCNAKAGYHIVLDPRPRRVGYDSVPGDEMGWRSIYTDGSTSIAMKEYITEDEPSGHYEVQVKIANSDGSWSTTEFAGADLSDALAGPGDKTLGVTKDPDTGDVGVMVDGVPIGDSPKKMDGDGKGGEPDSVVYIACPGPPHCVDGGFLGYIKSVEVEGWGDDSSVVTTIDPATSTPKVVDTVIFDTYRLIAKTVNLVTVEFTFDTARTISVPDEATVDTKRDIVYIDEVLFDTYRLIARTVNLIKVEFTFDTERTISLTVETEQDTIRTICCDDIVPLDTSRSITGGSDEVVWDTKRTIKSTDAMTNTDVVAFDTYRLIGVVPIMVIFDTKRTIKGAEPSVSTDITFDTKRTIVDTTTPSFIYDTKRVIKKPDTAYFDTKRTFKTSNKQTITFDTKRRKEVVFWEIPEYDQ